MKNYECPHCDYILSTKLDEDLKRKKNPYWAGFLNCPQCGEEYRLIVIKDAYIRAVCSNKKSIDGWTRDHDSLRNDFENNKSILKPPKRIKTWVNCISDEKLNQYFPAREVLGASVEDADDAEEVVEGVIEDVAIKIFKHKPELESVQLMCYYVTLAWTTALIICTIHNKPNLISKKYGGVPEWNRKESFPVTWGDTIFIDVTPLETPLL